MSDFKEKQQDLTELNGDGNRDRGRYGEDLKEEMPSVLKILKENTIAKLVKGEVVVTFNKINGDKRVMTCTKSFDIIPKENQPKSDKEPKQGTITVWDLNAKGWRSFKYDRVQTVLPVAQLDRASGYEPEGQEFESSQAGQILEKG